MPAIQVDGVTVNYHDIGSGDPVVLIHCSSSSHRQWRSLWELLQDNHRVIAIDMLDWGGTDAWPADRPSLLQDEAAIVREVIKDIDGEINLVGHSYGGTIAYHLAQKSPDLIKSLTLVEPMLGWILDTKSDQDAYEEIQSVAEYFWKNFTAGKAEEGIEHYFDYWNGQGAWQSLEDGLRKYVLAGAQKNVYEFEVIFEGGKDLASPEEFAKPTLLIAGSQTKHPTLRVIENLESRFPDARIQLIDGAGHMSPITHSDQVNTQIQDFLKG